MTEVYCDCRSLGSTLQSTAGKPPISLTTETCPSELSMKFKKASAPCRFLAFLGMENMVGPTGKGKSVSWARWTVGGSVPAARAARDWSDQAEIMVTEPFANRVSDWVFPAG